MFIYINKTLSGSLREPKNKGNVQLGNGPKVVAVASGGLRELFKQGFTKVVVTRVFARSASLFLSKHFVTSLVNVEMWFFICDL